MSEEFCPRQITFTLAGNPGVKITATENAGSIDFTVDVQDTTTSTADLRALFFDINEAKLGGMTVSGGGGYLTEARVAANKVLDLGDGATLAGKVKQAFDVGIEWGTAGGKKDDINFEVGFTLSNAAHDLTLDDIAFQRFGVKLDSIGGPGGVRNSTAKLLGTAPAAPDAKDDSYSIFEDNAAGLNSPSKTPTDFVMNVLANDTDLDSSASLKITEIHEQPAHGHVSIAADGKSLIYTPELDFAGQVSFEYCVSDGKGGQDHATVTLDVQAVADDPVISMSVAKGANINEVLVTVTATQNDADGSEVLDSIQVSNLADLPAGATITPTGAVNVAADGSLTQVFTVTTAAAQDFLFNVDFTATSHETSNGDTETATASQKIEIDYTHNASTLNFTATDQSIWSTGDAFVFDLHKFYGLDIPKQEGGDSFSVLGVDVAGYEYAFALKAGFQVDVHFEGGGIDATVPVDVEADSTYNKTTDTIYITTSSALGDGGSFSTTGPEGALGVDFIFNYLAYAKAYAAIFDFTIGPYEGNNTLPIVHFDSSDPPYVFDILPGIVEGSIGWPHISVVNAPGTLTGSGESDPLLSVTLDVDALANSLLGGALSFLDSDPTTEDNFEIFDLDIVGNIRMLQEFSLSLASVSGKIVLEDGTTYAITVGSALTIDNASSHDANHDGHVGYSFEFNPDVNLSNTTSVGADLDAQLAIIRNLDLEVTDVTVLDETYDIGGISIPVFSDTFTLNGVGSQTLELLA
jgi:hypothetical protein